MQEQPVSLTLRYCRAPEDFQSGVHDPDVSKQVGHLRQVHHQCTVEQRCRVRSIRRTLNSTFSLQLGFSRVPVLNLAILPPVDCKYIYASAAQWPLPHQILCRAVRQPNDQILACKLESHAATNKSVMICNL